MAGTMQDTLREFALSALQSAQGGGQNGEQAANGASSAANKSGSNHAGAKALAAGVGTAALAPMAMKGLTRLARQMGLDSVEDLVKSPGQALQNAGSGLTEKLGSNVEDKLHEKLDEAGGPSGMLKDTIKEALPFGGDGGQSKGSLEGVGKGRRMPIQQSVDIGIPLERVYNQFTQFEEWTTFMHRVKRATQEDDCTVSFAVKIWGKTNEFTAQIDTQRPDQRIKWKSSQGMTHAGVITFHELGPQLTRVILNFDLDPGSLVQKFARGARHVKRATRADLHRFAAYIEMLEHETGAWRGVIEDGEVVEEHDPSYDEEREYADPDALQWDEEDQDSQEEESQEDDDDQEDEDRPRSRRRRQPSSNGASSDSESTRGRTRSTSQKSSSRSSGRSSSGGSRGSGGNGSSRSGGSRSSSGSGSRSGGSRSSSGSGSRSGGSRSSSGSGSRSSGSGGSGSGRSRRSSGSSASGGRTRARGAKN
jgi:uncharacterized membrane protein